MQTHFHSFGDWLWVFGRSLLMGVADSVPGVSGGTIAFISGLYDRLINALRSLSLRRLHKAHWLFLLTVALGILLALFLFSHPVRYLLNHQRAHTYLFAAFFGLILGAITTCMRWVGRWTLGRTFVLAVGIVVGYLVALAAEVEPERAYDVPLELRKVSALNQAANYDVEKERLLGVSAAQLAALQARGEVAPTTRVYGRAEKRWDLASSFVVPATTRGIRWALFGAGLIAACALLLPGISGAYILHVLGFYSEAITHVTQVGSGLLQGVWVGESALFLVTLGVGVVVGLLVMGHLIGYLLKHFRPVTLAALTGLLIGALRAVWPFWATERVLNPLSLESGLELRLLHPVWPDLTTSLFWIALAWMVGAFVFVFTVEKVADARR